MQATPVIVQFASHTVSFTPESAASVIKLAVSLLALESYTDDPDGEISDSLLELVSIELGNAGLDVPAMVDRIHKCLPSGAEAQRVYAWEEAPRFRGFSP